MQTILGAGGVISKNLARSLPEYTDKIRLVSRNPSPVKGNEELFRADLKKYPDVENAVNGSDIVYLTAGLVYKTSIWTEEWPLIMKNVINACKKHNAKLVFFDNVYMYGKVDGWMTEETPYNPCSKKGEVRARIATMVLDEIKKKNLTAMIARSADFYGPNSPLSFINVMVFENLVKGKKPQLMINDTTRHSFTYTRDAGKATALLGNTASAYNQTWHLPTDKEVLTGREFIRLAAAEFEMAPDTTILKKWMIKMAGTFNFIIKESIEMLYQVEFDYLFDSGKFDNTFNFKATAYREGIKETADSMK